MTKERENQIVALYLELGTYAKVKDALGCSWDSICEATKKAGINKGIGGNPHNKIPDYKFIELANSGKTVKEIAKSLGVYNSTVAGRLRKLGIEPMFCNKELEFKEECKNVEEWTSGQFRLLRVCEVSHGKKFVIQCVKCGEIFSRDPQGLKTRKTRCPNCYVPRNKGYLRKLARAEHNKTEYAKNKECVICGNIFHASDERRKTCSASCAQILRESNHGLKRFRHKGGGIKDYGITLMRVYERDGGKCWICGRQTDFADVKYTPNGAKYCGDSHPVKDHIVPLSAGGDESWENIRLACWRCNKEKSDAIIDVESTEKGRRIVVSERCGKKDGSIPVAQYSLNGELIKEYPSMMQASRETGIDHCQISAARTGRQKTAHGYIWKTVEHEDSKLKALGGG